MQVVFSRIRLRTKLALLMGLSLIAVVVSIGAGASLMRGRMMDDRIDKVRAVVLTMLGFAESLQAQVDAHQISQEQALAVFRDEVHRVRFGSDDDYLLVQTEAGLVVMHGGDPRREGKPTASKDASGRSTAELALDATRSSPGGVIWYRALKPGQAAPQAKLSYVVRFAPWKMMFIAGAWIDDVDAAYQASLLRLGAIGGGILVIAGLVVWMISRDIARSLGNLKSAMQRLAQGDLTIAIPGVNRRDDVGDMATAVLAFRDHMAKEAQREAAHDAAHRRAAAEQRAALTSMADTIEAETGSALQRICACTKEMAATADEMSASAGRTGASAGIAGAAAAQALNNARIAASAAEQLSVSIQEIAGQVGRSTAVVRNAVAAGSETRATITALNQEVEQIGAVADMIGAIAAMTNLLALNATIEAARAGDAGCGFAVVATEVKHLATQTAFSTQDITRRIEQVRSATVASVAAVARIEQTITEINAIAGTIAAAVDQQGAATAEIARTMGETADTANDMTARATAVSAEAQDTGRHAALVHGNANGLNTALEELRHLIVDVLRAARPTAGGRYPVDLPCRLTADGQSFAARVADLSDDGACVSGAPALPVGSSGTLDIEGVDFPLPVSVRLHEAGRLHLAFVMDDTTSARFSGIPARLSERRAA